MFINLSNLNSSASFFNQKLQKKSIFKVPSVWRGISVDILAGRRTPGDEQTQCSEGPML
jgi:hypothetical protein